MDEYQYSCCIFLDLSTAFDIVNHRSLFQKFYEFRGLALNLVKSYLTNGIQYTKIGNSKSSLQKIECGISQGSLLDPLLFTLRVNNLPSESTSQLQFFQV